MREIGDDARLSHTVELHDRFSHTIYMQDFEATIPAASGAKVVVRGRRQ
jgi:hypothetical protein